MHKTILTALPLLLAAILPLHAQEDHVSCGQIGALPENVQALYVGGVMDGIGLSFSIADATANVLAGRAATPGEEDVIEQMRRLPQEYFDAGPAVSRADVVAAVVARCKADPRLSVDSVFMTVVGKS